MRKKIRRVKLNRDKDHKKALFRNLISALIIEGRIKTTQAKAKAIKGLVDKVVNKAKNDGLRTKDQLANFLTSKKATIKLYDDIVKRFSKKNSGFTRIVKIGRRRGDNAKIVFMEWTGKSSLPKADQPLAEKFPVSPAGGKVQSSKPAKQDKADKKNDKNKTDKKK